MHGFARDLFAWFLQLGPLGLVVLGILDSSFLVFPFGNDILVAILTAGHPGWLPIYVVSAAAGSMLGVAMVDIVCRKGGEEGLRRLLKPARFGQLEKRLNKRVWAPVLLACVAPPPFPFTAVIAAASAFQYPRRRLLGIVLAGRAVRFSVVGALALYFGRGVLRIIRTEAFPWFVAAFAAFCAVASVISMGRWLHHRRPVAQRTHRPPA